MILDTIQICRYRINLRILFSIFIIQAYCSYVDNITNFQTKQLSDFHQFCCKARMNNDCLQQMYYESYATGLMWVIHYYMHHHSYRLLFLSILALLPLLGGTWILGLLFLIDSDSVALAWIFTMVNSLQVINCMKQQLS